MSPVRAGMHRLWFGPCAAFPLMAPFGARVITLGMAGPMTLTTSL